jgi:hypothetical protein
MNQSSGRLKGDLLRFAVALALGLWLVEATGAAIHHISTALDGAPKRIAQGTSVADRQIRGNAFMNAIESIRTSIPKDGDYLLIEGRENIADAHVVRAYLVPRKAELLGPASSLDADARAHLSALQPPRYFVLAWTPSGVPAVGSTKDLAPVLGRYPWTHESASLLGGIDFPVENAIVQGTLLVRGWARIPGEDLQVGIEIDGKEREATSTRRFPRPDVCIVFPQMDDCTTAGFELKLELRPEEAAPHDLVVVFSAADGRIRHSPRRRLEWRR